MNISASAKAFKAYDIRGKYPEQLNEELCYRLGLALHKYFKLKKVVIGRDIRLSGPALQAALSRALLECGVDVTDIGICGTEEVYYAAAVKDFDLGIMLTASHNPVEYNGIKMVLRGAVPVSSDSGLTALRDMVLMSNEPKRDVVSQEPTFSKAGSSHTECFRAEYIQFLLQNFAPNLPSDLKVVMNPGNGCAALVLDELLPQLPFEAILINAEPDGNFPNGVPNPLLPERRADTANAVKKHAANLGIAWDGDFDRCFFYDENGDFVESYYLIGLIAEYHLARNKGAKIIHDTRLFWNTEEAVLRAGGIPIQTKTGHAFMKERLRAENALFGGEMSSHFYYRSFNYCDSGMLPWIDILSILSCSAKPLSALVADMLKAYPCSGEINFTVKDSAKVVAAIQEYFKAEIISFDFIDGLSANCGNWRFNVRTSNTEPLLRLNVESKADAALMERKTQKISTFIQSV